MSPNIPGNVLKQRRFFSNVFLLKLKFQSVSHLHCIKYFTASILFIMADGRVVETENLKNVLDAITKIKKKKEGQYEEKIIQVCVEEFDLNKEEVLTSLKKAVDDRMLKIVNKNNKNSYRIVQETHLDDDCVIDSQIHETLESTDVVKDLPIRLNKTSYDDLTKLANEFRLFKAEIQ